jgi:hypothetical protein
MIERSALDLLLVSTFINTQGRAMYAGAGPDTDDHGSSYGPSRKEYR